MEVHVMVRVNVCDDDAPKPTGRDKGSLNELKNHCKASLEEFGSICAEAVNAPEVAEDRKPFPEKDQVKPEDVLAILIGACDICGRKIPRLQIMIVAEGLHGRHFGRVAERIHGRLGAMQLIPPDLKKVPGIIYIGHDCGCTVFPKDLS